MLARKIPARSFGPRANQRLACICNKGPSSTGTMSPSRTGPCAPRDQKNPYRRAAGRRPRQWRAGRAPDYSTETIFYAGFLMTPTATSRAV